MTYYHVKAGRNPGVYTSWKACEVQVKGFSGASYCKVSESETMALRRGDDGSSEDLQKPVGAKNVVGMEDVPSWGVTT